MNWMVSLAQLLLSLSFLVAVHELGHLLAAKYFGMRVEQFSIGFPPKIWSFRKGETEYAISAIPLGGYVKISGMIDESLDTEAMKAEPQPWEFRSKPAWQRLIVMLGGIVVNIIVGVLIFIGVTFVYGDTFTLKDEVNKRGGFFIGEVGQRIGLKTGDRIVKINGHEFEYMEEVVKPETLLSTNGTYTIERDSAGAVYTKEIAIPANFIQNFNKKENAARFIGIRVAPTVSQIQPESIAADVGVKVGDRVVEVYGTPVQYLDEVQALMDKKKLAERKADSVSFKVQRGSEILAFSGKLKSDSIIGFGTAIPAEFKKAAERRILYNFGESIPMGASRAFTTLFVQIKAFGRVISGVLSPKESISGPIGIMQAYGPTWDWQRFWSLTGVLSLVLAFMNLLPIPALDGGHVMFLSYEIISRRKPSDKFLETAQKVGMVLLLTLMVFIFANDIIKLFQPS
jgi:regulator of sigma E protease